MSQTYYYNPLTGAPNYQPGNLTRSDSQSINCIYPYPSPTNAQQSIPAASFPVNATTVWQMTIVNTGEVYTGNVVVGAVANPDNIVYQLNQYLSGRHIASYNPATSTYIIDTTEVGYFGNFTVSINGVVLPSTPIATPGVIRAGRLVVPASNAPAMSTGTRQSSNAYRYPALGDTADILSAALLTILDAHTNYIRQPLASDFGLVTVGTVFAGLQKGEMVLQPITAITATAPLFVETNPVGDLAGRITATASATTLPLPNGKLRVMSPVTLPNQLGRFAILPL